MRLIKVLFGLLVVLGLVFMLEKNTDHVTVNLLFQEFKNVPLPVVMIIALAGGILVGFIIALTTILSSRTEIRAVRNENRKLAEELNSLRNVAIDEGIYEATEGEE